jgi:hypothetical protein
MNPWKGIQIAATRVVDLLEVMTNTHYVARLSAFDGSSVGQYVGHIIDFCLCLDSSFSDD